MRPNPVVERLGRPLRLGVVGGGPEAFIGYIHRSGAELDGRFRVVAGVLSSDPARSRERGQKLGLAPERSYGTVEAMLATEASRADGIEALAVMTPNDTHHAICRAALDGGLDIVCDKPLTNSLADAMDLVARVRRSGRVFCVTHTYAGYAMLREARAQVAAGAIGDVRLVQVEYLQAGMAVRHEDGPLTPKLRWKMDPARGGPSLVLGDIGTHAFHLAEFVSGRRVSELSADVGALVPGRRVHDYAMAALRFDSGARGNLLVSQAAAGAENNVVLRVFGANGHVEWQHRDANYLTLALQGEAPRRLGRGDPYLRPEAARTMRIPRGHPEGFREAMANLYADAAEAIVARRTGVAADPLALDFPTVEDGARGVAFIEAAVASSEAGARWTRCVLPD
ncbi:MAG: Gfo/Idh/MocA family oxidoreductase [Alphaproteobacteria bacterium]|nr:Gfo/Idh/MocA family oxidoreductase [Alphaproteobacteria bacterium]